MPEEKWLVEGGKIIDLGPITNLKVSLVGGQVDIIGHDEPTTRVEVHSVRGKGLKIVKDGDHLFIDHPQLNWDNFIEVFKSFRGTAKADVSVMVPRNVAVKLGVVSANALVTGIAADATLSTVGGELVADGLRGDVQLNSVSGELSVRDHAGAVSARSVGGEITVSGEVSSLDANTVAGNVYLDVTGTPDRIKVSTVSGNITTRLAPGTAAKYTINTVAGRIHLDDSEISGVRGGFTGKYGTLDQTWTEFQANTVSGDISVLHAVSA